MVIHSASDTRAWLCTVLQTQGHGHTNTWLYRHKGMVIHQVIRISFSAGSIPDTCKRLIPILCGTAIFDIYRTSIF